MYSYRSATGSLGGKTRVDRMLTKLANSGAVPVNVIDAAGSANGGEHGGRAGREQCCGEPRPTAEVGDRAEYGDAAARSDRESHFLGGPGFSGVLGRRSLEQGRGRQKHWARHSERYNAMHDGGFNEVLFAAAGIGAGECVLDVGCGTGQTTLLAARTATAGQVIGIDLSAVMLERASADLAGQRLTNVTFVHGSHKGTNFWNATGCGPGPVGGALADAGHNVVGVDADSVLIEAAVQDHSGPLWMVGDLVELDLPAQSISVPFDAIVCAGNVMAFLAPSTRPDALRRLRAHFASGVRMVVGFAADRGYEFGEFFEDAAAADLEPDLLSTWDLRPFTGDASFLVALLRKR